LGAVVVVITADGRPDAPSIFAEVILSTRALIVTGQPERTEGIKDTACDLITAVCRARVAIVTANRCATAYTAITDVIGRAGITVVTLTRLWGV